MILLIDNYDSFVFNLERYLKRLGQETTVVRSDEVELERLQAGEYTAVIISPGPKAPEQAGLSLEVIRRFHQQLPMLGVCLGHQAICQSFGARIVRAPRAVHGRSSAIHYLPSRLFEGLPNPFEAARYHSLVAQPASMPDQLRIIGTCQAEDGSSIIMAVEHERWPVFGVQFHPESILSEVGYRILQNFLTIAGLSDGQPLPDADFASPQVWSSFSKQSLDQTSDMPPTALPVAGASSKLE
jgi:anthranilate synthase/aminodeoxychorismate synthase-like glutamine amidotransferase